MNFVDDVFERRAQAEYVDPQVSVDEACEKIRNQIPVTLATLRQNGFPRHQNSKSPAVPINYNGGQHMAWVLAIGIGVPVAEAKKVTSRTPSAKQPLKAVAVYIEGDDPQSLQLKLLYCANTAEYSYTANFDIRRLSPPQAWAILKFLKVLADPPKLMPWEREVDRW